MFWLEAKVLNDMGMFWLINFIMMTNLTPKNHLSKKDYALINRASYKKVK